MYVAVLHLNVMVSLLYVFFIVYCTLKFFFLTMLSGPDRIIFVEFTFLGILQYIIKIFHIQIICTIIGSMYLLTFPFIIH